MYPHHLFMYTSYMYSKNPFQVSRTCWKRDDRMRPHVHKTLKSEYGTIDIYIHYLYIYTHDKFAHKSHITYEGSCLKEV